MTAYRKLQEVVAAEDVSPGWFSSGPRVPAGAQGVVLEAPWLGDALVRFRWESLWSGPKETTLRVRDEQIRPR